MPPLIWTRCGGCCHVCSIYSQCGSISPASFYICQMRQPPHAGSSFSGVKSPPSCILTFIYQPCALSRRIHCWVWAKCPFCCPLSNPNLSCIFVLVGYWVSGFSMVRAGAWFKVAAYLGGTLDTRQPLRQSCISHQCQDIQLSSSRLFTFTKSYLARKIFIVFGFELSSPLVPHPTAFSIRLINPG